MKKTYRGWKLTFADGIYTATKKGKVALQSKSRVGIERMIDADEVVEWRKAYVADIKRANDFIKWLQRPVDPRHIVCHNFMFSNFEVPLRHIRD